MNSSHFFVAFTFLSLKGLHCPSYGNYPADTKYQRLFKAQRIAPLLRVELVKQGKCPLLPLTSLLNKHYTVLCLIKFVPLTLTNEL